MDLSVIYSIPHRIEILASLSFCGEKQQMLNEIGETVYPISCEGTTYLPVRAICNLFDIDIT